MDVNSIGSFTRLWWLVIFIAALVLAMMVPLGPRHSGDPGDTTPKEKP